MSLSLLNLLYIEATLAEVMHLQAKPPRPIKRSSSTSEPIIDTDTMDAQTSTLETPINPDSNSHSHVEIICRICGKDADNTFIIDQDIVKDITTIASVQIEENDGLPNCICAACLGLLNNALLFKTSCEKTDKELRVKLKEMEQAQSKELEKLDQNSHLPENGDLFDDFHLGFSDNENTYEQNEDFDDPYEDTIEVKDGFIDCLICSRSFIDKECYKSHLSTCNDFFEKLCKEKHLEIPEKIPGLCEICGKGFKSPQALDLHRLMHTGALPFSCDLCPYRGRDKSILRTHMRTHTGERPYKCPYCPRQFINSSNRKRHLTVHETQRRYKCSICHKGISTKLALKDHERSVHFGMKDYECDICHSRFVTNKTLRQHRIRIHKKRSAYTRVSIYLRQDEEKKLKQLNDANRDQENMSKQHNDDSPDIALDDQQQYNL